MGNVRTPDSVVLSSVRAINVLLVYTGLSCQSLVIFYQGFSLFRSKSFEVDPNEFKQRES